MGDAPISRPWVPKTSGQLKPNSHLSMILKIGMPKPARQTKRGENTVQDITINGIERLDYVSNKDMNITIYNCCCCCCGGCGCCCCGCCGCFGLSFHAVFMLTRRSMHTVHCARIYGYPTDGKPQKLPRGARSMNSDTSCHRQPFLDWPRTASK